MKVASFFRIKNEIKIIYNEKKNLFGIFRNGNQFASIR